MTALDEAIAARNELHLSDAWKLYGGKPTTHTALCGKHLDACVAALQTTPPPPPVTPAVYATFTGGDFDAFVRSIPAGKAGGLAPGAVGTLTRSIRPDDNCSSAVTLVSVDPTKPGTIKGRVDVRSGCAWTFHQLRLAELGATGTAGASWVIASPCHFVQCDLTNNRTKIGLMMNAGSGGFLIDRCHVHDIGEYPVTNGDHGIYVASNQGGTITDSVFEFCSDRGIQLREAAGVVVQYVLVQNCGEGIIFGDLTTRSCTVTKSVVRNNAVSDRFLIEALGDVAGNTVTDSYAYNEDGRPAVQPGIPGATVSLHTGAAAAGYGPRYAVGM